MMPAFHQPMGTGNCRYFTFYWVTVIWPIKAEYLSASLDSGYTQTIIARNARDYVWIMARTPSIPEADYARHVEKLRTWGYHLNQLRRVPQMPPRP